jgi:hypothetical protein
MIPLMICVGGREMGMLPEYGHRIDWIPVNYGAACVADIVINSSTHVTSPSERVHHILNPHVIKWTQLLEHLKSSDLRFTVVSTEEWLRQLLDNPKSPAYALAPFFTKIFSDGKIFELPQFSLHKTVRRTAALEHCPAIDQKLVQRYLEYWLEVGFLKPTYIFTA